MSVDTLCNDSSHVRSAKWMAESRVYSPGILTRQRLDALATEIYNFNPVKGAPLRDWLRSSTWRATYNHHVMKLSWNHPTLYKALNKATLGLLKPY